LKDSDGGKYYSGDGRLQINKTTVTGSPGAISLTTPLSWEGYVYSDVDDAPMIIGSGLTGVTNASGQVTISKASSGNTWVGGTNIVITTNGTERTISTDGNLQSEITANSATGAAHTVSIANLTSTQIVVKATADAALPEMKLMQILRR